MRAGAIALLIVIFSAGWVVTSGSAKAEAKPTAGQAVLDRLASIDIAQFMQDPNKEERLKELKELDSYGMNNRTDCVKEQGWATMPGDKEPDRRVAGEVADLPAKLRL
jgi:hypothetical protein